MGEIATDARHLKALCAGEKEPNEVVALGGLLQINS
jgi:hypothetical protein